MSPLGAFLGRRIWGVCLTSVEADKSLPGHYEYCEYSEWVEAVTQDLSGCGLSFVGSHGGKFDPPDKSRPIGIKVLSPNCRECRVVYEVRGSARK